MNKFYLHLASLLLLSLTTCFASSAQDENVSAYLRGDYVDVATAKEKLREAGFSVVATYTPVKEGTTIIFTDEALKKEAAKPGRAHAAVLRMFVDDKEKKISITNPIYFGKAFMQDDYEASIYAAQLASINNAFVGLKGSVDKLDFDDLADFHFMLGMPYYDDSLELGEGTHDALLSKAKNYKDGKLFLFALKLSDSATLVGYALSKRTNKFVKKIGRQNAALLPWMISIENSKATALSAKYYIALNYPLLSMGDFMGISTVPGAVEKELQKPFK
jgi:hypothetical protein